MLVVVLIGGVVTGVVLLAMPDRPDAADPEFQARRLEVALEAACDQALLTGNPRGVRFHARGYDFWRLADGAWERLGGEQMPRPGAWPSGLTREVRIDGFRLADRPVDQPQLVCDGLVPSGSLQVRLAAGGRSARVNWPASDLQ